MGDIKEAWPHQVAEHAKEDVDFTRFSEAWRADWGRGQHVPTAVDRCRPVSQIFWHNPSGQRKRMVRVRGKFACVTFKQPGWIDTIIIKHKNRRIRGNAWQGRDQLGAGAKVIATVNFK